MDQKDHIIAETDVLFCRHGIKSITMDDVAARLGMSKKTIYQHFSDKDELVRTLIRNKLAAHRQLIDHTIADAENAIDEIFRAVGLVKSLFLNINPTLFYDLQKYHPDAWSIFRQFRDEYLYQCIENNLRNGMAAGLYRKDIDVDILTRLRLEHIDLVFNSTTFPPERYTPARVMVCLTDHFVYGLATRKGQDQILKYKSIQDENLYI